MTRFLKPSLGDLLFVVILALMFASFSGGWQQLLSDSDTGWHIRNGQWILEHRTVPHTDLFSFSKSGAPWYAWEWLADVIFAAAYLQQGLKGVVLISALLICTSILILFRYMIWRGAGIALAVLFCIAAADASKIHYLARPHVFTLVLLPLSLWLLDRDRERHDRLVWLLVPIAALWANLHGGFLALIACLGLWTAGSFLRDWLGAERALAWVGLRRHILLTAGCGLATLINPYGYQLHVHVAEYLKSDWIARHIDEFQAPRFSIKGMDKFEALLFLGLGSLAVLIRKRRYEEALLVGFWAHAALQSVRHVPLYMLAAAPIAGTQLAEVMDRYTAAQAATSWLGTVRQLVEEFTAKARRGSIWLLVLAAFLWFTPAGQDWPSDFPDRFPSALIGRNLAILSPVGQPGPRLFSSDEWGGYLIFRLYPRIRVFIDGRSDFYGPEIGNDYICLMRGCGRWAGIFERWRFDTVLLPVDWPLAEILKARSDWRVADQDKRAVLFQKLP